MFAMIGKLRRLLTRREQWQAVALLCILMTGAALEMLGVGAIPAFVTLLSDPQRVERITIVRNVLTKLPPLTYGQITLWGAGLLLALFVIKNSYLAVVSILQARYVTNRQVRIAALLFRTYLESPYVVYVQRNSAELLRNATNESMDVVGAVLMPLLTLSMESLTVGAIFILLLVAEPLISLVALSLLGGATLIFARAIRHRLIQYGQEIQNQRMKLFQAVNEGLGSLKVARVLGRELHFYREFASSAERFAEASRYRQVMTDLPRLYLELAAMSGLLGVAALLIAEHRPVQAIIPTLSLLAVAVVRMIPSFNRITSSLTTLRYGRYSLDVVYKDLGARETRTPLPEPAARPVLDQGIRFWNVSFAYPGSPRASLVDITLEIPRGKVIGVVGATGAGKTTLIDLLLGLLEPTSGKILIDDRDMRDNVSGWQRQVGYVPQDIYLVDDTIRRNVAFGLPDDEIDDAAVNSALEAAQLSGFVDSLPAGFETVIGERGVRLSGGQRQRIGIARALYHQPSVLVFDEATSSLDNETERSVMEAVDRFRGSRTIILVAHRMSTVRSCDQLFLLADRKLVASGSFDSLLRDNARFKALVGAGHAMETARSSALPGRLWS